MAKRKTKKLNREERRIREAAKANKNPNVEQNNQLLLKKHSIDKNNVKSESTNQPNELPKHVLPIKQIKKNLLKTGTFCLISIATIVALGKTDLTWNKLVQAVVNIF